MARVRPAVSLFTLFTTRRDGNLRSTETENRARLFAWLGIAPDQVVNAEQVHGGEVARVSPSRYTAAKSHAFRARTAGGWCQARTR